MVQKKKLLQNLQSDEISSENITYVQKLLQNKTLSVSLKTESNPSEGNEAWQTSISRTLGKSYPNLLASETNQSKDISETSDRSKDQSLETETFSSSTMKKSLSKHSSLTTEKSGLFATEKVPEGTSEADTSDINEKYSSQKSDSSKDQSLETETFSSSTMKKDLT